MKIDRLLGVFSDIEKEIYEDQLDHLKNGILINKSNILNSVDLQCTTGPTKALVRKDFLFSMSDAPYYFRTTLSLNSNACLFYNDIIELKPFDDNFYWLKLISKGTTRKQSEIKSKIFDSTSIINDCLENLEGFLSHLTIESFVQFNYIPLFSKLNILNDFFKSINSENYESNEIEFKKQISLIVLNQSYKLGLPDVYFYQKYLQLLDRTSGEVNFTDESTVVLKNSWNTKDRVVL